jgi:predicted nucleic acid-binding protein
MSNGTMNARPRVYLDTSVISALIDDRNPERMSLTRDFMKSSDEFDIHVSEITIAEIERIPNTTIRAQMRALMTQFRVLTSTDEIAGLAMEYISKGAIPKSHPEDAYHIAVAVINGIDYLLSWNFKHIVRLKTRQIVGTVNSIKGLPQITILTPGEML